MRRIVLVGLALLVSTLGTTLSASARLGIAPMATQDDAMIQVKHGRGHGHGLVGNFQHIGDFDDLVAPTQ